MLHLSDKDSFDSLLKVNHLPCTCICFLFSCVCLYITKDLSERIQVGLREKKKKKVVWINENIVRNKIIWEKSYRMM